jgi:hypothetical protein
MEECASYSKYKAVNKLEDGIINLEADIIYQNLKSDGSNDSYPLHYSTFLKVPGAHLYRNQY